MSGRPRLLVAAAAVVGALVTVAVLAVPEVPIAHRAPSLHLVLETTASLIAALTAYLLVGRYHRRLLVRDLVLIWALVLLVTANLPLSALPRALLDQPEGLGTWWLLVLRSLAAAAFAVAALLPAWRVRHRRRGMVAFVAALGATGASAVAIAAVGPALPLGVDVLEAPAALDWRRPLAHPGVSATQGAAVLLFGVAAVGFARRADVERDELLGWVAGAATLSAFARIHYALFPSLYTVWVYPGDLLRLGSYLLLLAGAAREISASWQARAQAAVLEERRRIARDLHDGLAQELAFILGQSRHLARRGRAAARTDDAAEMVASAAQRALDESRRAVAALSRPLDEPLEMVLTEEVEGVAGRHGVHVRLDLGAGITTSAPVREALLRVAREAVGNAARHSGASEVTVRLSDDRGLRLLVTDDGAGFDPDAAARNPTTFGLVSMRERIEALGGSVRIDSRPGAGTTVEASLPYEGDRRS